MTKIFLIIFLLSVSRHTLAITHCACEIGQDKSEKSNFQLNCGIWLKSKSCSTKTMVNRQAGTALSKYLPRLHNGDKLLLGYVGNWSDSTQTLLYVEDQLIPLLQKKPINIFYENLASNAMDDPDGVQDALVNMSLPVDSQITIKGSQTIAVGLLESILADLTPFHVQASTEWLVARFMNCNEIEGKSCSAAYQALEKGRCHDTNINRRMWLYCKKSDSSFGGDFKWLRDF